MLQQSSLVFDFPPLVMCSTFFCCSNKCCHNGSLVVTSVITAAKKTLLQKWQNKYTTKATKVNCFFDANTTTTAAKNTMKQGHYQGHNNQHALANATKVDCCSYFLCVSLLQSNDHCQDMDNDAAPCKTCCMMHNTKAKATMLLHKKQHYSTMQKKALWHTQCCRMSCNVVAHCAMPWLITQCHGTKKHSMK